VRRVWPLPPLVLLIVVFAVVGSRLSSAGQIDVVTGLVQISIVIGLYTFVGVSGVFSFGHVAYVAVGAYVSALLAVPVEQKELLYTDLPRSLATVSLPPIVAILVGGVGAAVVALLLAPALGRLAGLGASLATFAVLVIVHEVAINADVLTRGQQGVLGVPLETTIWSALVWTLLILVIAFLFQASKVGLELRAAREDGVAAQAVGVYLGRLRGVALVLSAFLVGLAGGVYAQVLGSFNPDTFYLDLTFLTIAMLVVGGLNSLSGAVVGGLLVTILSQLLRRMESAAERPGLTEVAFALLTIAILVARPGGITGGREIPFPGLAAWGALHLPRVVPRSSRSAERTSAETSAGDSRTASDRHAAAAGGEEGSSR
jgi:branched-chain amino acid transport system permease protein